MALLRPSLTLVVDLDERVASSITQNEIKRCYAHITTPVIRTHSVECEDEPVRNTMRALVNMGTYRYLHSADEGADERWADIVEPWIANLFHKVGNNMKVYNDRQRSIGNPEVHFDRMDIELQGGDLIVGVHTSPTCLINPETSAMVGAARTVFNDGDVKDVVRIDMPTDESYAAQYEQAYKPWIAEHPEQTKPEPETESVEEGETLQPEPEKTREQLLQEDIEAKSYENTRVAPTDSSTLPPIPHEEEEEEELFDFAVDYGLWTIVHSDGTTETFDAGNVAR